MTEQKLKEILTSLNSISNKEWEAVKQAIDNEFARLRNRNTLEVNESILKNVKLYL